MALSSNSVVITNNVNKKLNCNSSTVDVNILHDISNQLEDIHVTFTNKLNGLESKVDMMMACYSDTMDHLDTEGSGMISNSHHSLRSTVHKHIPGHSLVNEEREHRCCKDLIQRFSNVEAMITKIIKFLNCNDIVQLDRRLANEVAGVPAQGHPDVDARIAIDSNLQVITLNKESDYPDGSWLGDINNLKARVRVPITPSQLLHINTYCTSASKMAIVLVDRLFSRDVLATSNLSGKGPHSKKQLDPLFIFGIRSHLIYKFKIKEKEWHRIKQNIDSKCRSAWKKRMVRLRANERKNQTVANSSGTGRTGSNEEHNEAKPFILSTCSLSNEDANDDSDSGVMRSNKCNFKIVRTTAEQLAKLQDGQTIRVFTNEDAEMFPPSQMFSVCGDMDTYTLTGCGDEQTLTIVTENGEVNIPLSSEDSLGSELINSEHLDPNTDDD